MSYMFESFLKSIPKNRSEMVNDLDIPDDVRLTTEVDADFDDLLPVRESLDDSLVSEIDEYPIPRRGTLSTDSSTSLSKAMTDSEIDYYIYKRMRDKRLSEPFSHVRDVLDRFPPGYLTSLERFQYSSPPPEPIEPIELPYRSRWLYNEELERRMRRFFDEEVLVWTPEDPGLLELEAAMQSLDLKILEQLYTTVP